MDLGVDDSQKKRDKWAKRIEDYNKTFTKFSTRAEKIIRRYRDERSANEDGNRLRKFNMLWSMVQTLGPAVYSKPPKPEVTRRYFDKDPVGRLASSILERALQYEMDVTDFHGEALLARDDYLLVGRGTLWQRYEPIIEEGDTDKDQENESPQERMNEAQLGIEALGANGGPVIERVIGENAPTDYVHWKDFLHGQAQNWKQVPWVGRKVLMNKAAVDKRWPDGLNGKKLSTILSFTHRQEPDNEKTANSAQRMGDLAVIYEFWDKDTYTTCWYSPDVKTQLIEEIDDPLGLTDFFPCPPPLFATMTTDRLIPVADYKLYQDQAEELDVLTQRIHLLTKALAVRGVYDASNQRLADLLIERPENFMVPVDNWAAFAEKGGLQGQMSFVPIDVISKVLGELNQQAQLTIQKIYEITGIADIIRGTSVASETATAQQIKGQFANLRLSSRRDAIANFLRSALRIKAEVMAEHFDQQTLRQISGFDQMTEVATAKAAGQNVDQLWQQAYDMLKNDPLRLTHLDVETDSMIEADIQQEQQARVQFLQSVGAFLQQAIAAATQLPQLAPLLGQMISWGVRGFKVGRELESSIDAALEQLEQAAANPPPKPPTPEEIRAQVEQQKMQQQAQQAEAENARTMQDIENDKQKNVIDARKVELDHEEALEKIASDERLAIMELNLKYGIQLAEAAVEPAKQEEAQLNA